MSAAGKLAQVGAGVKGLAIGAAIIGALALAVYLVRKAGAGVAAAKEAGGFLFGSDSAPETLGTKIFDALNPAPDYFDEAQARKTCLALYPPGAGKIPKPGSICEKYVADRYFTAL